MGKFSRIWKTLVAGGAGMAALAAVNSAIQRGAKEPSEDVFGGEPGLFRWKYGDVYYKTGGNHGEPILLIHGIGAGSSSFTWRKNFDVLSQDHRVFALDMLGFGMSAKPATAPYSAELYTDLIRDFIDQVIGEPVHLVASSLGGAYAVKVACENPARVSSLILISPTGVGNLTARPGMAGAAFYGLLQSPVLGTSFYNVVASERSIRDYAASQLFYDQRRVTDRFVSHHYAVSHLPGAQFAIAAFLSGFLNTDIRSLFGLIEQPVSLVWGRDDVTNPVSNAVELIALNNDTRLEVFDRARMLPHEEHPERFNELVKMRISTWLRRRQSIEELDTRPNRSTGAVA